MTPPSPEKTSKLRETDIPPVARVEPIVAASAEDALKHSPYNLYYIDADGQEVLAEEINPEEGELKPLEPNKVYAVPLGDTERIRFHTRTNGGKLFFATAFRTRTYDDDKPAGYTLSVNGANNLEPGVNVLVGREDSVDVKASDMKISRRHMTVMLHKTSEDSELRRGNAYILVKDLSSGNGTYVDKIVLEDQKPADDTTRINHPLGGAEF